MKLYQTLILNNALQQIAMQSAQSPKEFPILVKLALAENIRLVMPHAQDYVTQRDALNKEFEALPEEKKALDSPERKKFLEDQTALGDAPVNTKFRILRESDLKDSPLTIEQIGILQASGVLIVNEVPQESNVVPFEAK